MYREHAPCPALARHVACYWTMRSSAPFPVTHRVLPDGCVDLLFSAGVRVGEAGRREGSIVGVMSCASIASSVGELELPIDSPAAGTTGRAPRFPARASAPAVDLIGVRFAPGEAGALLGLRADETRDAVIAIEGALGLAGRELASRIVETTEGSARIALLDRFLLDRLTRARPADPRVREAVRRLQASPGRTRIDAIASDLAISERQLERAFDERVGLSPKRFARVMRLQALRGRLAAGSTASWAALAQELGFADQAHLVRETRALVGTTPTQWVSESFKTRSGGDGKLGRSEDEEAR